MYHKLENSNHLKFHYIITKIYAHILPTVYKIGIKVFWFALYCGDSFTYVHVNNGYFILPSQNRQNMGYLAGQPRAAT